MRRDGSIATDSGRAPWAPSSLVLHVAEVTCCVHVRIERVLSERKPRERCVLWVYKSLGRVDGAFSRSFSFFFFFFFLKYFFFSTEISSTKPRARSIVSRGLQGCHERVSRVMHTISRELLDWRYLSEFPVRC